MIITRCVSQGSLANWHPHRDLLVTDGGFRPDGTFVGLPLHGVATLTEAFGRAATGDAGTNMAMSGRAQGG